METRLKQVYDKIVACLRKERIIKGRNIDIPFMAAALYESFEVNGNLYYDLLDETNMEKEKWITYVPDHTGGYTNGKMILEIENANFYYEIQFQFKYGGIDEWDAPRVKIFKSMMLADHSWSQNEESYIEFCKGL